MLLNYKCKILKNLFWILVTVFLTGTALPFSAQPIDAKPIDSPKKRALLIGISEYRRNDIANSYRNLKTEFDIELLTQTLTSSRHNFSLKDIKILQNKDATNENILSEMRNIKDQTKEGDIVFIYFAGHGKSIPDDGDDEIDGYDESLIPYDYESRKDDSKNIRDDEIGKILDALKLKKPASVLVAFDSCFSGTATRGDYDARGGDQEIFKPANESPSGLKDKNTSYPKEFVFLAAAAANPPQTASETTTADEVSNPDNKIDERSVGVFTYGLVKALNEVSSQTTYLDLFERITGIVTTIKRDQQTPQIEGSLNEIVFDGTAVKQEKYYSIKPIKDANKQVKNTDAQVELPIGYLHGATAKSQFTVFSAGTKDTKDITKKIVEGEIIKTDALTSILKLNKPIETAGMESLRVFETQHKYKDSVLKVVLQDVDKVKNGDGVLSEFVKDKSRKDSANSNTENFDLAEFSLAEKGENLINKVYDIKIYPAGENEVKDKIVPEDFRGLILERKNGSILDKIPNNAGLVANIKLALEREYRILLVKGLKDYEDKELGVKLNIIKVDFNRDDKGNPVLSENGKKECSNKKIGEIPRTIGGQSEIKVGDCIMLEVENRGESDVYVSILNLQADSIIAPGFPNRQYEKDNGYSQVDNFFPRRDKPYLIPFPYIFRITDPIGDESFIAIATKEPTNFTPLVNSGSTRDSLDVKGANAFRSPLGKILMSAKDGTRSPATKAAPTSWAISSFSYKIVK